MENQEVILVVVDPNDDVHVAFDRAILTAPLRDSSPKIHVLVTTDAATVDADADNDKLYRSATWFEQVIRAPLEAKNLDFVIEICWSHEWQQSILRCAERINASQILLPMHTKPYSLRLRFSESKWELLRAAKCPVVLVRPNTKQQRKTILAAVNFQATDPQQKELNRKILQRGHWLSQIYKADLHVVNGYMESIYYPDRGKLANESRLPPEKIHVVQGYTDDVVSEVAREINADLVILGTLGQNGKNKTRRGNTAERVISAIEVDAVIINA